MTGRSTALIRPLKKRDEQRKMSPGTSVNPSLQHNILLALAFFEFYAHERSGASILAGIRVFLLAKLCLHEIWYRSTMWPQR